MKKRKVMSWGKGWDKEEELTCDHCKSTIPSIPNNVTTIHRNKRWYHVMCAFIVAENEVEIYRNALINIWKLAGKCWDGERECTDPQQVASEAVKKADPAFHDDIDIIPYVMLDVSRRSGKVIRRKRRKA